MKEAINARIGVKPEGQELVFGGVPLENEKTIVDYGICAESLMIMTYKVIGGS
jgi:hypothetical protein